MSKQGFSAKDRIRHATFGLGTISVVDELYTTVVFDEGGTRRFANAIVRFERSDAPAPAKPAASRKKSPKK